MNKRVIVLQQLTTILELYNYNISSKVKTHIQDAIKALIEEISEEVNSNK